MAVTNVTNSKLCDMSQWLHEHRHGIAGLGAGAVSTIALYPLDLIKVNFQVEESYRSSKSIYSTMRQIVAREGGLLSLYRGMSPALYGAAASWGLYFYFYENAKEQYSRWSGKTVSWHYFASGIQAGACCIPFTNPIWLIKVRMQVQAGRKDVLKYTSVSNAFTRIVREEGIMALYKGALPALFLTTHGAVKFVVYESLKKRLHIPDQPALHETLTIGSVAQIAAHFATYPYQVIKARIQQGGEAAKKYTGILDCGRQIIRREGVYGFYKGFTPNLIKVLPTGAITFAAYEQIIAWIANLQ